MDLNSAGSTIRRSNDSMSQSFADPAGDWIL